LNAFFQRWNFIERAKLERQLWDAFERGENIDALVADCRAAVESGDTSRRFQLDVWVITLQRIRRIETLMRNQPPPGQG
jgi:hypothetical protein